MKAPQAKELLKRVVNTHGKLSYKECENIAKDLNLSLDQVGYGGKCNFVKESQLIRKLTINLNFFI